MRQMPDDKSKSPRSTYTFFPDQGISDGEREEIERSKVTKIMSLMMANEHIAGHFLYELWRTNRDEDLFTTFKYAVSTSYYNSVNEPVPFGDPFFEVDKLMDLIKKAVVQSVLFIEYQSLGNEYINNQKDFLKLCCEMFIRGDYTMELAELLSPEQLIEVKNHYNLVLLNMSRDTELGIALLPIIDKYFLD